MKGKGIGEDQPDSRVELSVPRDLARNVLDDSTKVVGKYRLQEDAPKYIEQRLARRLPPNWLSDGGKRRQQLFCSANWAGYPAQHLLRYEYPQFREKILLLSETPATTPGTAIEFQTIDGGRVFASNILYFHAFYLLSVLRFKKDVDSVCEIGGGYGNPALLWLTNPIQRVSRYVIVDMPESLFFAEVFLRTAVPDIAVHYATEDVPASQG